MNAPGKRTAAIVVVMALLVGAGLYINARLRASAVDHAVALVPADARAYLHVFLKPSTSQRRALRDLLEKFPETDNEDEARTFVTDLLSDVLARIDVTVDDDVGEWVGHEAAAYLPATGDEPVVLLAVDDEDRARRELEDALGPLFAETPLRFVDGFVVIGEGELAVDNSLADDADYDELVDDLEEHRIALFFTDGTLDAIGAPSAATLSVTSSSIVIDAITEGQAERLRAVSGFAIVSITGVRGALSLEVPSSAQYLAPILRATADIPGSEVVRTGETITLTIGGTSVSSELPAGLAEAADARLGENYEPTVVIDASGVPVGARSAALGDRAGPLTPAIDHFLTLDLGVREGGSYTLGRLVITFGDA